jgi:hypothetical protein
MTCFIRKHQETPKRPLPFIESQGLCKASEFRTDGRTETDGRTYGRTDVRTDGRPDGRKSLHDSYIIRLEVFWAGGGLCDVRFAYRAETNRMITFLNLQQKASLFLEVEREGGVGGSIYLRLLLRAPMKRDAGARKMPRPENG